MEGLFALRPVFMALVLALASKVQALALTLKAALTIVWHHLQSSNSRNIIKLIIIVTITI